MARYTQQGAASLFAVIFSMLLLTVLTVGFIKLMITDQQRATNNDLSQSAYDSALAGVEDAKRVVRASQEGVLPADFLPEKGGNCNVIAQSGVVANSNNEETLVRSGAAGETFEQAYTCVKINMNTPDFLYKAVKNKSQVIPLKATGDFDTVVLEWYKRDDEDNANDADATDPPEQLPKENEWGANTPSLLRAQLINPGQTFNLATLDSTGTTTFLKPKVLNNPTVATELDVSSRHRATDGQVHDNTTDIVFCAREFTFSDAYACQATLKVGTITRAASANAFLRLNSLYKGASVKVTLKNATGIVNFDGVQPSVDSTGRANNLFRRVEARLQIGDDFAYPDNAVELINSLCKDFSIVDGSILPGQCRP